MRHELCFPAKIVCGRNFSREIRNSGSKDRTLRKTARFFALIEEVLGQENRLTDFRIHDLRHTCASCHRQAGTSTDELKDLDGWKSRVMVQR